jgi:hypothetical protein
MHYASQIAALHYPLSIIKPIQTFSYNLSLYPFNYITIYYKDAKLNQSIFILVFTFLDLQITEDAPQLLRYRWGGGGLHIVFTLKTQ